MISRISGISTILLFLLSACNNQGEVLPINGIVERIAPQFAGSIVFEQIEDARKLGKNQEEADYYEKNARNIITTWGGEDNEKYPWEPVENTVEVAKELIEKYKNQII